MPVQEKKVAQTGPRTRAGKAVASRNAMGHGIMSPHPGIIEGLETEDEWDRHVDGIVANLAPEGVLEEELAERIATLFWRLRRVTRYETAVINHQVAATRQDLRAADAYLAPNGNDVPDPEPLRVAAYKEARVIPLDADIDKIMRYETHIHRLIMQTLHELEALQARRHGEQTHLARLDISSPPSMWPAAARLALR
jgi:hypothetical protein